jgi:hypothetical protein
MLIKKNEWKKCIQCGSKFFRNKKFSSSQWESQRFCSRRCSAKNVQKSEYLSFKNRTVTQDFLKEILSYDPDTGRFKWIKRINRKTVVGSYAENKHSDGYLVVALSKKRYFAHRLAWLYMEGYLPEHEIDHKNRIRHDNRWKNLRHVTRSCNVKNCSISRANKSGIKGVHKEARYGRWVAMISLNNSSKYIGSFGSLIDAACARLAVEQCLGWKHCDKSNSAFNYVKENLYAIK